MEAFIYIILIFICLAFMFYNIRKLREKGEIIEENMYKPVNVELTGFSLELLAHINLHRQENNIPIVVPEKHLCYLAEQHCEYMSTIMKISHDYAFERKYDVLDMGFSLYGEITGGHFNNAESLFKAYLRSSKHNATIEHEDMTHVGIAFSKDLNGKWYNTVIFAKYEN